MKQLDKTTGQFKNVYVKALDSMPVGTIVDFDGTSADIPTGWEEISDNMKILWTNPNPTANFNAQTITLSSDDYDMYEVICSPGSGSTATQPYISSGKIPKGKNYVCQYVNLTSNDLKSRTITYVSDTSLSVAIGYNSGITSPNITQGAGHLIPQYVIGYKTGLFN